MRINKVETGIDSEHFTESQSSSKYTKSENPSNLAFQEEKDYFKSKQKILTQQQINQRLELKALDELLLPIELQGNFNTLALFDTDCNYSAISKKAATALKLQLIPVTGIAKSWDGSITKLEFRTKIKVRYGKREFSTIVDVCDNLSHDIHMLVVIYWVH